MRFCSFRYKVKNIGEDMDYIDERTDVKTDF